jgi:hypothetical protein
MEAIRIIMPTVDRKPCVCGATLQVSRATTIKRTREVWLCSRRCGARGLTYEGALRRKVRVDLLNWGYLKRNAQTLIEAEDPGESELFLQ